MNFANFFKFTTFFLFFIFFTSCSKRKSSYVDSDGDDLSLESIKQNIKLEAAAEAKMAEEKKAKERIDELAKQAEMLAAKLLQEKQEKEQQLAADLEAKRLADIASRQEAQKMAFEKFIGTEYDELVLETGKTLRSAKATKADPIKVTFVHRDGVSYVKYKDLPEEICILCKFDEELTALELERINPVDLKPTESLEESAEANAKKAKEKSEDFSKASNEHSITPETKASEHVAQLKGHLLVKVVASQKGFKTIQIEAKADVDAKLHLHDLFYHRDYKYDVKAGQTYNHKWRNVGDKYEIKLVANDTGKILGFENHSNKNGGL